MIVTFNALIGVWTIPATAQDSGALSDETPGTFVAPSAQQVPSDWIATLTSGVITRDGDTAQPYVVAGLSRKIGRGYLRAAVTGFRSVVRQVDAVLPSTYAIASLGAGGTFGSWFVDGYVSGGRQRYGGVTTPLGTRASQIGQGSGVYGAALNGGRFVALSPRLYLTPSASLQFSTNRALRSSLTSLGPVDYETSERAWTGSATVRVDRYFGGANQHLAGLSVSRVQTTNGATLLAAGAMGGTTTTSVADGWFVLGSSASVRVAPRLWIDGSATRTITTRSGNFAVLSLGVRLGFGP
ncbi:hypothetical protein [Sphingomonas carotinifaciens]|uniref:hypothetical protein n=1 Tax=Sphingomonas carotinifaciens TaxID=1166323 RepID=UPI00135B6C84|nr:hypothetical protein [Sphingomonas carotinifaciens]